MTNSDFKGRFIGVLGGMGPLAGATFMVRLALLTPATIDQDHIPAILWNDPRVPGRPAAYLHQGEDPFPWMMNGIRHLEASGAKAIAVPCNTAHLWFNALREQARVPIFHIVDAVITDLQRQGIYKGRVGLMATATTLEFKLYQTLLEAQGYECIIPDATEVNSYCTTSIELVKKNLLTDAQSVITPGVTALHRRGAQAVILGCTELPLALPHAQRSQWGIPIIDSIDALAHTAIDWYASA